MAFVAVDKDGSEWIYEYKPLRKNDRWDITSYKEHFIKLPSGSIRKLIGRELTFEDEPVELKDE